VATPDIPDLGFDDLEDALGFDLDPLEDLETESQHRITTRKMRSDLKHETIDATKRQALAEVMPALPGPGECYHIVSNGDFDYWTWIPSSAGSRLCTRRSSRDCAGAACGSPAWRTTPR